MLLFHFGRPSESGGAGDGGSGRSQDLNQELHLKSHMVSWIHSGRQARKGQTVQDNKAMEQITKQNKTLGCTEQGVEMRLNKKYSPGGQNRNKQKANKTAVEAQSGQTVSRVQGATQAKGNSKVQNSRQDETRGQPRSQQWWRRQDEAEDQPGFQRQSDRSEGSEGIPLAWGTWMEPDPQAPDGAWAERDPPVEVLDVQAGPAVQGTQLSLWTAGAALGIAWE